MNIPDVKTVAYSYTNGLRAIVKSCDDREVARRIHAEMKSLAHELAVKHQFASDCKEKRETTRL